jgi:cellulase/cellobiase CelA1
MCSSRKNEEWPEFWNARLAVDESFEDPSGLKIALQSATSSTARIAVDVPSGTAAPVCLDQTPVAQDALCSNRVRDHGETDVDCGGPCAPCNDDLRCASSLDCWSRVCTGGVCQTKPAACDDGIKNGTESDIDCGGTCSKCPDEKTCKVNTDCRSNRCNNGICVSSQLSATLRVHSDWNTGFCGDITLTNTGSTLITNWKLRAKFADSYFTNTWNAYYWWYDTNIYEIVPYDSTRQIWPKSSTTIGFCSEKTGPNYKPQLLATFSEQ